MYEERASVVLVVCNTKLNQIHWHSRATIPSPSASLASVRRCCGTADRHFKFRSSAAPLQPLPSTTVCDLSSSFFLSHPSLSPHSHLAMSTSTRYVADAEAPHQPQPMSEESDIDPQTKANTLANAAATSSSSAPHIISAANAPKDELAMKSTADSDSGTSGSVDTQ